MKQKKAKAKKRPGNRLVRLGVVIFAVYSGFTILQLQADVRARRTELAELQQKCEQQRIENKELELRLSAGDDADYIVRTARERLDFVYPYEKVFINASGS
ncbi:MAG: hypothetical protein HFG26_01000 [Provencibacterium sp.]|jgi:cell division protein FtsB|nr:hypothetical protein [Provencibacterium sp.]